MVNPIPNDREWNSSLFLNKFEAQENFFTPSNNAKIIYTKAKAKK